MRQELAMKEITTVEPGSVVAAIVGGLTFIGGFVRWFLGWKESRAELREKKLDSWEQRLQERDAEYHAKIEARLGMMERKVTVMGNALFTVVTEVQQLPGTQPALTRAKKILQQAYPVEEEIPEDIAALLHRLGEVGD